MTPGEPSRVAVLAVDEGILQVARYRNPDPLGFFFQKRMLEVETRQILDLILPDFKRFLALAAPGGDADGRLCAAPESVQPEAQAAGRVLVGRGRRRPRRARAALHRARLLQRPAAHRRDRREPAAHGRGRSRHRGEGRFHPDAERAGDGGAGRRVPRQRRRLQQHAPARRVPSVWRRSRAPGLSLVGSGERRSRDRREARRRRRVPHQGQRGAGRARVDLRRAPRRRRRRRTKRASACGPPLPTGRS